MQGTEIQWFPVTCQGIFGSARTFGEGGGFVDSDRKGMLTSQGITNNDYEAGVYTVLITGLFRSLA
jgi:hypothetical protein